MKYGGSAMMGLSQGLQTGLDWGMKMNQIKYEVAQKKKLDDEQEALNQTWADFGQNMSKLYDSGTLSDLDMKEMTMITLQLPQALQQQAMQTMNFLKQGQKEEYEKSLKDFEMTLEFIKQTGAQGDYTSLKKLLDEDQIKIIDAVLDTYKSLPEQSQMEVYSSVEALRQVHGENAPFEWNSNAGGYVPKYETGKNITPTELKNITGQLSLFKENPSLFEKERQRLQQQYGIDLSNYTPEIFQENNLGTLANLYNSPEQVVANVNAPAGLTVVPKRDAKTGQYYADFQKEGTTSEEDGMTAGEKRIIDTGNQVLFGESDIFAGIQKPGLISSSLSQKLNRGVEPTPEEVQEVLQSWNHIKNNYNSSVQNYVDAQLSRYGISSDKAQAVEISKSEPEQNKPGLIERAGQAWNTLIGKEHQEVPNTEPPENPNELEAPKNPALYTPEINKQIEQDKQNNSSPESVKLIQQYLKDNGYWNYEITGNWNELLENKLRMFYREQLQ